MRRGMLQLHGLFARVLGGVLWVADLLWDGKEPALQRLLEACRDLGAARAWLRLRCLAVALLLSFVVVGSPKPDSERP